MALTSTFQSSRTAWTKVAQGAQDVTLTAHSMGHNYALTPVDAPPAASVLGGALPPQVDVSMALGGSDFLWVRGGGLVSVTGDTLEI